MPKIKINSKDPEQVFRQFGWVKVGERGNQSYGTCPFCKYKETFHINIDTKAWDCKHCQREGGYQTFLKTIIDIAQQSFTPDRANALAELRGITVDALRSAGVGYYQPTHRYLIPVYECDGETIQNVRSYSLGKKGLIGAAGGTNGMYGQQALKPETTDIWIVEGGWDWIVMCDILKRTESDAIAIGAPDAGMFKHEWAQLFEGKDVHVVYDNDHDRIQKDGRVINPARQGMIKVYNTLKPETKSIEFVHWVESWGDGFDVNDLYADECNKDAGRTMRVLKSLMRPFPPGVDAPSSQTKKSKSLGPGLPANKVHETFTKWLELPDATVIDIMYGAVIANRGEGKPVWMLLVGPSGCGKSELIGSLDDCHRMYRTSSLTAASLVSGFNAAGGHDPSVLPILNQKVFAIGDLTPTLQNVKERDLVFGILRDSYDGYYKKKFGHLTREYRSKFGIIAGTTTIIEMYSADLPALGERFVRYNFPINSSLAARRSLARRARSNRRQKTNMSKELNDTSKAVLDYDFPDVEEAVEEINNRIIDLAELVARARGAVLRERYSKEIIHDPDPEVATRLSEQFDSLGTGIAQFRRVERIGINEYSAIKQIAKSCMPTRVRNILRAFHVSKNARSLLPSDLEHAINLPRVTVQRVMEDMRLLNLLDIDGKVRAAPTYKLSDAAAELIGTTNIFGRDKE